MRAHSLLAAALALGAIAFLPGCEDLENAQQSAVHGVMSIIAPPPPHGWWNGEGASGPARIMVHLGEQKAYFYKGKRLVGMSTISSGKRGFGTPPGHYHVISKDRDHRSSEFGDYVDSSGAVVKENVDVRRDSQPSGSHFLGARMNYCMHFNGGYAMHQGYVPPYAASHGCIRIPEGMAHQFYSAAPVGTPVIVEE